MKNCFFFFTNIALLNGRKRKVGRGQKSRWGVGGRRIKIWKCGKRSGNAEEDRRSKEDFGGTVE